MDDSIDRTPAPRSAWTHFLKRRRTQNVVNDYADNDHLDFINYNDHREDCSGTHSNRPYDLATNDHYDTCPLINRGHNKTCTCNDTAPFDTAAFLDYHNSVDNDDYSGEPTHDGG